MILITGTGHSGTTAFWRLLGALGYRLGHEAFPPRPFAEILRDHRVKPLLEAGRDSEVPWSELDVIKHLGGFCYNLEEHAQRWGGQVDHIFVLLRDLDESVNKRVIKGIPAVSVNHVVSQEQFDELDEAGVRKAMRDQLCHQIGHLMFTIAKNNYPVTILDYPRFVEDRPYCFQKISAALGTDVDVFNKGFDLVFEPTKVHKYV